MWLRLSNRGSFEVFRLLLFQHGPMGSLATVRALGGFLRWMTVALRVASPLRSWPRTVPPRGTIKLKFSNTTGTVTGLQPTTIPRQAATRQVDTEDLSKTTTPASRRRRRPTHPPNARLTSSTPDLSTSPVHSGVRTDRATRRKARPDRHKRSRPPQAWDKQSSTPIHPITHQRPQHSRRSIVVFGCAPAS